MPWVITRQSYSSMGEDALVVEVCGTPGETRYSIDNYSNPGALVAKYAGEFETFIDPREAAKTAVEIRKAWAKDSGKRITIREGFTGGSTCPFDEPAHGNGVKDILAWAEETYKDMPKCPECGEIMGKEKWKPTEFYVEDDEACCSERCCEKRHMTPVEEDDAEVAS